MTAPTLTSEQREAQKAMRQALAEALHEGLDGDFLIEAGMGADNEGENVGISEVQPKELVWWAVYQVAPVVAVMVADAAHEAAAKEAEKWVGYLALGSLMIYNLTDERDAALRRVCDLKAERDVAIEHGYTDLSSIADERDALAKELADLRGAVEALAEDYERHAAKVNEFGGYQYAQWTWQARSNDLRAVLNASSNP